MARKKQVQIHSLRGDPDEWVTAGEAAKILSANSKRKVGSEYLFKLGAMGKVGTKKMSARVTLYNKQDVETYIVEPRGTKSGKAKIKQASFRKGEPAEASK